MKLTEEFISSIMFNYELNKTQLNLLGFSYPPEKNWDSKILNISVDQRVYELLVLLKGQFSLKAQEQIIKNYDYLKNMKVILQNKNNIQSIYCDGACEGNPGEAGSGIAIYYESNQKPELYYGNYEKNGTNNIAELNALKKSLEIAKQSTSSKIISIYSDSLYSINCIQLWAKNWENNNWTKKGGEIKNLELIKSCYYLYEEVKSFIELKHVKAHSGIEGNELADRMAVHTINVKNIDFLEYKYNNINNISSMKSF